MSGLTPEAEAFAADYRKFFMPHLVRMQNDHDYIHTVRELRKTCEKCDMDIAKQLSGGVGGKKRSKKHCKKRSKKNMRRCTTSRRRSRARRSI
jgi:hypothetical protein